MESSAYYKCADCGRVLDRRKFPEDQPCPYCDPNALQGDKTYRGSRARRMPGVTPKIAAESAKKREERARAKSRTSVANYAWAALALLALGALLPYATPIVYDRMVADELAATEYISEKVHVLNQLSTQLIAEGNGWPQAASATAAAAPGGMLNYTRDRLHSGASWCLWLAILTGVLGGACVAMLYLRAIQWPDFRPRAHLYCLFILFGVVGLNFWTAHQLAQSRAASFEASKPEFDAMLGMLVYADLRQRNAAGVVSHLANGAPRNFADGRGATYLHVAAENGVIDVMQTLLTWGMDVNRPDNAGMTPLHYATANGQPHAAEILIDNGARIAMADNAGRNVLHFAAMRRNAAVLEDFIDRGLDINALTKEGKTPLLIAAESGNTAAMSLLLERGADLEFRDADGHTLLQVSLLNVLDRMFLNSSPLSEGEHRQLDVFKALLSRGADVNVRDSVGQTPLHWVRAARERVHNDKPLQGFLDRLVQLLVESGADVDAVDLAGERAYTLHDAARVGHVDVARRLIEENPARVARTDAYGRTPFQRAVEANRLDVAALLLENGADVRRWPQAGDSALAHAIDHANLDMVRLLIEHGAGLTSAAEGSEGPLLRAARSGSVDIVAALLDAGSPLNEKNAHGNTALHIAAAGGHEEVVTLLLDRGADTSAWNRAGQTPLDVADDEGSKRVAAILRRLPSQVKPAANLTR